MAKKLVVRRVPKKRILEQRLKNSIDVCGQRYTIEIYKRLELQGECDYEAGVIRLRRQAPDRMLDTLIHEVFHAIFDACGLDWIMREKLKISRARWRVFEEDWIRLMTPAVLATFRGAGWLNPPKLPRHPRRRR